MTKSAANEKYVKEIVTDYEALSVRCDEIDLTKQNKEAQEIILSLKNTIRANPDMVALSANQIGYDKRIICLNFNGDIRTLVNPIITNVKGFELSREYCHSIPECGYLRPRNSVVDVTYQTPLGKIQSVQFVGLAAKMLQHHIDHLEGLLLSDLGLEVGEEFDNATEEEREELINYYLDSLDIKRTEIKSDIETDEEAKQISDAVRFMESVRKGETVLEEVPLSDQELQEQMDAQSTDTGSIVNE